MFPAEALGYFSLKEKNQSHSKGYVGGPLQYALIIEKWVKHFDFTAWKKK